ncbi:MAG: glycosyltransferase [Candidatus Hydrogenedentes bacterium]|nr:glycosyltransferase [Candidatus Hydrogenedentota bacterium]
MDSQAVKRAPALRLAYLTNQYPSVSHTFIRREIRGLEARGYEVMRLAIRRGSAVVDPEDEEEARKTYHCLAEPLWKIFLLGKWMGILHPVASVKAFWVTLRMAQRSNRGYLRHIAYLFEALVLYRRLKKAGIRHVHVHFGTNAAAVARLIRVMGGPSFSMTVHGPDEFDAPVGLSLTEKILDSAFTVAISEFGASQLRRWTPHPAWPRIEVVHCTVADEFFAAGGPVAPEADTLVCVGRLSAQKGHLLLVEAFASLVGAGVPGRLVLVGDGELRELLEKYLEGAGLRNRVHITGWQTGEEVRAHLLRARALVLASFAEGLPVVIMEAMALQRPVIATRIAGIPELVRPGVDGWIVTPGNVPELAAAMREALTAPVETLHHMGAAAAARAGERHRADTEVEKLDQLFRAQLALSSDKA